MRWFFFSLGLLISAGSACAQEQENKLIDRLLRPDLSLSNSAQNKKFNAVDGTPADRKFVAKSFYSSGQATSKTFAGGKNFFSKQVRPKKLSWGDCAANASAGRVANGNMTFATNRSSLLRRAFEAERAIRLPDYPDNRPFLAKGTRQKALSQEDKPLTIEEVRELLNKSK